MAFPGPGAHIYRNEAGEPIGWDYPSDPDPDPDEDDEDEDTEDEEPVWIDDPPMW